MHDKRPISLVYAIVAGLLLMPLGVRLGMSPEAAVSVGIGFMLAVVAIVLAVLPGLRILHERVHNPLAHFADHTVKTLASVFVVGQRVRHNGQHHAVNDHWHIRNTVPYLHLAARSREELEAIKDGLLTRSNKRPLTLDELDYLKAVGNHFDVRTAINFLGGRHHREFGFTGVDQVHGNTWTYPCGCKLAIVFDHHKAQAQARKAGAPQTVVDLPDGASTAVNVGSAKDHVIHMHTPHAVCVDHAQHAHDLELLRDRVTADNQDPAFAAMLEERRRAQSAEVA